VPKEVATIGADLRKKGGEKSQTVLACEKGDEDRTPHLCFLRSNKVKQEPS
jgi:hypothetical protein